MQDDPQRDWRLFKAVDLFFRQEKTAEEIGSELGVSRQAVYPLLAQARARGLVVLNPPIEQERARQIEAKYNCNPKSITVVNVSDPGMGEHVAARAAERVTELIREVGATQRNEVGLGLGPGRATRDFSRSLGQLLSSKADIPKLRLFAISAGGPADMPEYASTSFFNLYPPDRIEGCIGLFAETLVPQDELESIRTRPGVVEAFERKNQIKIVVTAMGEFEDEHDLLRRFLVKAGRDGASMKKAGWVGNVQYRPYTSASPVAEKGHELRAVTLFELSEFVQLANTKNSHVVLIARQCAACGRSRARGLLPLLKNRGLKVWSEIVMDLPTANELLDQRLT